MPTIIVKENDLVEDFCSNWTYDAFFWDMIFIFMKPNGYSIETTPEE